MTDVIRQANGPAAHPQSSRIARQDPHRTSGYDGAIGERNLVAPESGKGSAGQRLGAASPAGWFLPADGEAAPPFRPTEPARSDALTGSPGGAGDDHAPVQASWPFSFPTAARGVRVVGPTEALRRRAGGPDAPAAPGAVAALADPAQLDSAQRSSWQLAQDVWLESGVTWERLAPDATRVDPAPAWAPVQDAAAAGWPADTDLAIDPAAVDPPADPPAASAWPGHVSAHGPDLDARVSPDPHHANASSWPGDSETAGGGVGFDRSAPGSRLLGRPSRDTPPRGLDRTRFAQPAGDPWAHGSAADDSSPRETARFRPATGDAWLAGDAEAADRGLTGDDSGPGSDWAAGFEPAARDSWLAGDAEVSDRGIRDADSGAGAGRAAGFGSAAGDAWVAGDAEVSDRGIRDADSGMGAGRAAGFGSAARDSWLAGDQEASDRGVPEPSRFEPDDDWATEPGPEDVRPGETWFTGVGPADGRLAATRSAGHGQADDEYCDADDPGVGLAAHQEFGWPGPGSARRDQARPNQPRFTPIRPEPVSGDQAWEDAIGLGSAPARPPRPRDAGWTEYPPTGFPGQAWPVGSGRMPLGAPVAVEPQAADAADLTTRFYPQESGRAASPGWIGADPLSEPDELFRAWQGSVNQAAAGHGPWAVPRRAATATRRRRALQAAAIGVPAAVIVTVGAGALMMLTGTANEMLAVRADTSTPTSAATASGTSAAGAGVKPTAGGVPPAFVSAALSGYPGQRGAISVASLLTAAGATVAVGAADGHPAIWRQAGNGTWTLESSAGLATLTGSAGLTSIAHGPSGWIAVGATASGTTTVPVVFASADGVHWQPVTALAGQAGTGTEFLGAAASGAGYVVVGRQMAGGRTFAVIWYSADLRSWAEEGNGGLDGRLQASAVNAIVATPGGFVAVGSHGASQAIWASADGRQWQLGMVPAPADASSATLRSVVASGTRVVAGGYAATRAGDIPVIVSTGGGGQWGQVVLQSPDGLGLVTALTATPDGFTAAGLVGRGSSQHAVIWTSADGMTWSRPTQTAGTEITALTVVGKTVVGTTEQGPTTTVTGLPTGAR